MRKFLPNNFWGVGTIKLKIKKFSVPNHSKTRGRGTKYSRKVSEKEKSRRSERFCCVHGQTT
jgi:hypothetical protein